MKASILSQSNYCPLVWMFCNRTLNCQVNHAHERALRFAYNDCKNDFGSFLGQSNSMSIHVRNLQLLMMEIFKTKFDWNPPFMKDIFIERRITDNLRHGNDVQLPKMWTTSFRVETLAYLGNKLWKYLPHNIKQLDTLFIFKKRIRLWNGDRSNCRLCRSFIPRVGILV